MTGSDEFMCGEIEIFTTKKIKINSWEYLMRVMQVVAAFINPIVYGD